MTSEELAKEIALGYIALGTEGGYDSVSCSSAGDYPSMGVSQWEGIGGRGDGLLQQIEGGDHFVGRTYSDIESAGELDALKALLDSEQGQAVQQAQLAQDCLENYVPMLQEIENLDDSRCFIYAGLWCTTSTYVVEAFLKRRQYTWNVRSLDTLRTIFRDQYYIAADVGEQYAQGYANRADSTFDYVAELDLSQYGVPEYQA